MIREGRQEDLQEIRGKLDQIDRQFVELLEERLDLCGQVAADKIKTGKAVFDKEREQQKLASVRAMAGNEFNARAAEELFTPADDHQPAACSIRSSKRMERRSRLDLPWWIP